MKLRRAVVAGAIPLLALAAAVAQADELPLEKPGLWEVRIKMSVQGAPAEMPEYTSRKCVDAATQEKQRTNQDAKCSQADVRKTATGYVMDTVCKDNQGGTVAGHIEYTGDFDSAYTMTATTHAEGHAYGKAGQDSTVTIESRWLGASCTPGAVK